MEVHQLRYFCAVARHGTFTRASEVERVAQPSLSQQILKLEAELGARLFDRLPRSARLTVFGRTFLPKAERILRQMEEAKSELRDLSGEERGEVVIGIIPTIAAYLLPRLLKDFNRRHPQVSLKVVEEITPTLLHRLHEASVDLAIAALPVQGNDLECQELFKESFYAVLPDQHPLASSASLNLLQLKGEPFLLLKEGHCFRESVISACRKSRVTPSIIFESGQFATILAMVSAGMGVSAVPAMAVKPQPGCKFVPLSGKHNLRSVGIVTYRHRYQARAMRHLIQHMREALQTRPHALSGEGRVVR